MSEKLLTRKERIENLRKRVEDIKPQLPQNWRHILITTHPKYDCLRGIHLIGNVYKGRSTDEELTEILEKIAATGQNQIAN